MGKGTLDVLCAADLCVDVMVSGDVVPRFGQFEQLVDGYSVELGGSATIFACQFAKLGGRVGLIGAVGEDAFGDFILSELRPVGVDLRRVRRSPDERTGLGLHLVKPDGDRGTLTYTGTIDGTPPELLTPDLLADCRHWHVASMFLLTRLRDAWPEWLRRCREAGLTISLDTNWDPEDRWEGVRELLPLVDVFLPNEQEARAIAGVGSVEEAGERLSSQCPLVVIKRGSDGATAFREGQWRHVDAAPPRRLVDAVGAGDTFDAGYLHAWLQQRPIEACLAQAVRCASASLEEAGGVRGQRG